MLIFSLNHLILISLLIILPIIIGLKISKSKNNLSYILLFLLFLEISKFLFLLLTNNFQINNDLPLQLCYLYPFIGIIYLKTKKEFLLNYLGAFGIFFSIFAIIFTNPTNLFDFHILYCYTYHFFLLISGIYIVTNFKVKFSFKNILIMFIQITIAFIVNSIIKNGSNYIFLNTFLDPFNYSNYIDNVAFFNVKFYGISINDILILLINNLGMPTYLIIFTILVISFSSLWLYIFSNKN